ncbi:MAG TPA: hydroxysqualene dehydroxylase HpnE [Vicinamibacterales bacterium]|nr:hydroxysqualene dehydroxylase HpnE [Vicinamibacterales bacterium]
MSAPDAIVIGAGVAGLRAGVQLAARGARVLLLESKAVLGGRATAFNDPQTGERVDNGQHVMLGCYHETFAFLRQIGTEDRVRVQAGLEVDFVDTAGERSRLSLPGLPPPINFIAGLLDWSALSWRDRLAALQLARPIQLAQKEQRAKSRGQLSTRLAASPGETVEEWLINNGQTARIREMLWEPLALAALNQSVRVAAAPSFVAVLAQMFGGGPKDASLALPTWPLDQVYAEPARTFIEEHGGEVRIGCTARVHVANGAIGHVEARGERLSAAAVVAAVPWYALADLFAGETGPVDLVRTAAAATKPSPIASVNLWLDRRIMRTPFLGLPGRSMQWVFDKEQMFEAQTFEAQTSHITLVSSGADEVMALQNDAMIALALNELRDALPEARAARVTRASVVRERRATYSLAPGQPPRPATLTDVKGLVLAGDWIETGLPATIEGAAISGRRAAEALLAGSR